MVCTRGNSSTEPSRSKMVRVVWLILTLQCIDNPGAGVAGLIMTPGCLVTDTELVFVVKSLNEKQLGFVLF